MAACLLELQRCYTMCDVRGSYTECDVWCVISRLCVRVCGLHLWLDLFHLCELYTECNSVRLLRLVHPASLVPHASVLRVRLRHKHAIGSEYRRLQVTYGGVAVLRSIVYFAGGFQNLGHFHAHVHLQQRARVGVVPHEGLQKCTGGMGYWRTYAFLLQLPLPRELVTRHACLAACAPVQNVTKIHCGMSSEHC